MRSIETSLRVTEAMEFVRDQFGVQPFVTGLLQHFGSGQFVVSQPPRS
jgi:hypothetical protein